VCGRRREVPRFPSVLAGGIQLSSDLDEGEAAGAELGDMNLPLLRPHRRSAPSCEDLLYHKVRTYERRTSQLGSATRGPAGKCAGLARRDRTYAAAPGKTDELSELGR